MEYTSLGCAGLKIGTPYHDGDTFMVAPNSGRQLFVLAVENNEPPTKKICECGTKETQLSLILVIVHFRVRYDR